MSSVQTALWFLLSQHESGTYTVSGGEKFMQHGLFAASNCQERGSKKGGAAGGRGGGGEGQGGGMEGGRA